MPDVNEFASAVVARLRLAVPAVEVTERTAVYVQGGPKAGQVTYNVGYPASGESNARIIGVTVDVDVWTKGPDNTEAENIASLIETALVGWSVNTVRQGTVRLKTFDRSYMTDQVEKLAHITMRFTGRAFRRLE